MSFRLNRIRKVHTSVKNRELYSTNLQDYWQQLGFHPHEEEPAFFLDWSFEHQFNSSSRTWSETIGKWVLLMEGVITFWGAVITDITTKLKICMSHVSLFLESKKIIMIRLHWSTFLYTCLVTPLHLSTFVCDSSTLVWTRRLTRLCF